tara:strand:- start:1694 stop:2752 length:1059 start_codon:yes stop_codon:yes gene_type:complete
MKSKKYFGGVSPFRSTIDDDSTSFEEKVSNVKQYYTDLYSGPESKKRAERIHGDDAENVLEEKKRLVGGVSVEQSELDKNPQKVQEIDTELRQIFSKYGINEEDQKDFFDTSIVRAENEVVNSLMDKISRSDLDRLYEILEILDTEGRSKYNRQEDKAIIGSYRLSLSGAQDEQAIANEVAHASGALNDPQRFQDKEYFYEGIDEGAYTTNYPYASDRTVDGVREDPSQPGLLSQQEASRIFQNLKPNVIGREDIAQDKHHQQAYEIASDIQTLRFDLYRLGIYNPGEEEFNQSHLDRAREIYKDDPSKINKLKQLESMMEDEGLIDTMNYLVKNEAGSSDFIGGVGDPRQA